VINTECSVHLELGLWAVAGLAGMPVRAGEAGCRTDFSTGFSGIFTKRRMSWRSLIAELYPQRDLAEFTIWEIGQLNFELIYPELPIYEAEFIRELKDNSNLPYQYLNFYYDEGEILWRCHFCNFWSDLFDQRLMELHLLKCSQVTELT
jgi:hypothetical protein